MSDLFYCTVWIAAFSVIIGLFAPWKKIILIARSFPGFPKLLRGFLNGWRWQISVSGMTICCALVMHYFGITEQQQFQPATFAYSIAVSFCLFATLTLLSKRIWFSSFAALTMILAVHWISSQKFKKMYVALHAYDIFFLSAVLLNTGFSMD